MSKAATPTGDSAEPDLPVVDATTPGPENMEEPAPPPPAAKPASAVTFTRTAALWAALIIGLVVVVVLLVFIAQNTDSAPITFLGWTWNLPLGVALMGAAVLGASIAVLAGAARMAQLRRAAKRNLKGGR